LERGIGCGIDDDDDDDDDDEIGYELHASRTHFRTLCQAKLRYFIP
jgi:hypothetical protein